MSKDDDAKNKKTAAEVLAASAAKDAKTEASKNDSTIMRIKVYAPFKTYFDDDALSVSAVNDTGPFDILPRHHNFMTLLNQCDVIIRTTNNDEQRIPINRGVMHVKADKVDVFLDV